MRVSPWALPSLSLRCLAVWRRNALVWRKLVVPSMLGNLADPMLYMLGFGYGLGAMMPSVGSTSYIAFIAAGTVCSSTMMSATFESMYSAFSRMQMQRTWDAILNAPVALDDIVLGEAVWAASKSLLSGAAVLVVASALGLAAWPATLAVLPVIFLTGLAFASLGLVMTSLATSYDFFMYYTTLVITPMMLLCGVFFPTAQLPHALQLVTEFLPLTHAVEFVRAVMHGTMPPRAALNLGVLCLYTVAGFWLALALTRRRLLR